MGAFQLLVRRDPGYELRVSVKFTVNEGGGIISIPQRGSPDAAPSQSYEEGDISADALRGGRFIHLLPESGKRQSYALSRLTTDKLARLPDNDWTPLDATTEFGFRYAVLPDNLPAAKSSAGVAVAVAAGAPAAAAPSSRADKPKRHTLGVKRPAPVASVASTAPAPPPELGGGMTPALGVPTTSAAADPNTLEKGRGLDTPAPDSPPAPSADTGVSLPKRPVAMESTLAESALKALSKQEVTARLQSEMQKTAALHQHIDALERKLLTSRTRERDLMQLLQKWQAGET